MIHVSRSTAKSVLCQLCGTLLVGETTFVAGVALSADGGIGDTGCTAVGIATHYFLLAAFGWMLADAVYGNFDVIFGDRWSEWLSGWSMWWLVWWCPSSSVMSLGLRPFHTRWLALTTPLVLCDFYVFVDHAYQMLIGACGPMSWPMPVLRYIHTLLVNPLSARGRDDAAWFRRCTATSTLI